MRKHIFTLMMLLFAVSTVFANNDGVEAMLGKIKEISSYEKIEKNERLEILAYSEIAGVNIVANKNGRQYFLMGHSEYDRETLANLATSLVQKGKVVTFNKTLKRFILDLDSQ